MSGSQMPLCLSCSLQPSLPHTRPGTQTCGSFAASLDLMSSVSRQCADALLDKSESIAFWRLTHQPACLDGFFASKQWTRHSAS
mmetsp:Transcript_47309/g.124045  ORF Transcript_47309/g.124045 Transcript_47309/m.124045 type:complete len:84 (-) Transcript_47309:523-774(-)